MHRVARIVIVLAAAGLAGGVTVAAPAEAQLVGTECACNVPTSTTTTTVAPTTTSTGPLPTVDECVDVVGTLVCVRFHDDTGNPAPYARVCVKPHFLTTTTCAYALPDDDPFLDDVFGVKLPSFCLRDTIQIACVNAQGCVLKVVQAGFVCHQS